MCAAHRLTYLGHFNRYEVNKPLCKRSLALLNYLYLYLFTYHTITITKRRQKKCRKKCRGGLKETIKLMLLRPSQLQFFEDGIRITATDTGGKSK